LLVSDLSLPPVANAIKDTRSLKEDFEGDKLVT